MKESCDDLEVLPFGLTVRLRVICGSCELSKTKEAAAAYNSKEFIDKLRSIILENVAWDAKMDETVLEIYVRSVR